MKKKIALFLNFNSKPGGAERRFARYFLSSQYNNSFLIINKQGKKMLEDLGIVFGEQKIIVIDPVFSQTIFLNKISTLWCLWWVVMKKGIRHIHYPIDPSFFTYIHSLLLRLTKVSYSISLVDSSRSSSEDLSKIQFIFWKKSLLFSKKVDILSNSIQMNMRNIFGFVPKYSITPCSFTDYSRAGSILEKDYEIILMSRMVEGKGFELFFEALDEFSRLTPKIVLGRIGIFGTGPLLNKIKFLAGQRRDYDIHVDSTTDPFYIFSRSKIFLSLQSKENYPSQSILEALSCGVFVIATDVGETHRIVPDNIGIRVSPNAHELANAIVLALDNINKKKFNPENNINFVKSKFSQECFTLYFDKFLDEMAD